MIIQHGLCPIWLEDRFSWDMAQISEWTKHLSFISCNDLLLLISTKTEPYVVKKYFSKLVT